MEAGKIVYKILNEATRVTDIVGNRIFPHVAKLGTDMPLLVYEVSGVNAQNTKTGPSNMDIVLVEVRCYAKTYTEVNNLAKEVRLAMDYQAMTFEDVEVTRIYYNTSSEVYEDYEAEGVMGIDLIFQLNQKR